MSVTALRSTEGPRDAQAPVRTRRRHQLRLKQQQQQQQQQMKHHHHFVARSLPTVDDREAVEFYMNEAVDGGAAFADEGGDDLYYLHADDRENNNNEEEEQFAVGRHRQHKHGVIRKAGKSKRVSEEDSVMKDSQTSASTVSASVDDRENEYFKVKLKYFRMLEQGRSPRGGNPKRDSSAASSVEGLPPPTMGHLFGSLSRSAFGRDFRWSPNLIVSAAQSAPANYIISSSRSLPIAIPERTCCLDDFFYKSPPMNTRPEGFAPSTSDDLIFSFMDDPSTNP